MGELEVKRALAFLNSPQAGSWSQAQKVEFLRTKLNPTDFEEVFKRMKGDEDDLSQFFDDPKPIPAPVAHVDSPNYGIYSLVGAGLLFVTSAFFFTAPESKKKKRDALDEAKAEELKAAEAAKSLEEAKAIQEVKDAQQRLEASLAAIEQRLDTFAKKEVEPKPALELDLFTLHRKIAAYLAACAPELKGKVLGCLVMWLQKIEGSPQDKTLTRINTSTPKYKNEVGVVPGVEDLMSTLGFSLNASFWEFAEDKLPALREGLRILTDEQTRHRASASQVSYNSSKPWLLSQPSQKMRSPEPKTEAPLVLESVPPPAEEQDENPFSQLVEVKDSGAGKSPPEESTQVSAPANSC